MNTYQTISSIFDNLAKHELPNAIAYVHEPKVAPLFYRYIFYNRLNEEELSQFVKSCRFNLTDSLIDFYQHFNGLRINQKISIFGSLLNQGWQPISLDYGNLDERPIGLPDSSTVIGGLALSPDNNGYLISHKDGSVTCTSSIFKYDEIKKWSNIETLIRNEIDIN